MVVCQFFTPYLSVDLRRMASAFQVSVEELEEETAALIMANQLQARIDSQNKTLHRRQVDRRDAGYLKVSHGQASHHRHTLYKT